MPTGQSTSPQMHSMSRAAPKLMRKPQLGYRPGSTATAGQVSICSQSSTSPLPSCKQLVPLGTFADPPSPDEEGAAACAAPPPAPGPVPVPICIQPKSPDVANATQFTRLGPGPETTNLGRPQTTNLGFGPGPETTNLGRPQTTNLGFGPGSETTNLGRRLRIPHLSQESAR